MTAIFVLGGGLSDERDVSLRSSAEVLRAVEQLGYQSVFVDPAEKDITEVATSSDIVLPILHGKHGEDGEIQRTLENNKLPFLGADSNSSGYCFDKWKTREILLKYSIPMPNGEYLTYQEYEENSLAYKPHVLKIVDGGSSIGTYIQRGSEPLKNSKDLFSGNKLVLEELIIGNEITVSILGDSALPVVEIIPPVDGEFDYENKYNGKTEELCPPLNVPKDIQAKAQTLALEVHQAMKCRHFSRVDVMVDSSDNLYVLEINTIPGLTAQSLFPKAAAAAGMNMNELIYKLFGMVAKDYDLNLDTFKV